MDELRRILAQPVMELRPASNRGDGWQEAIPPNVSIRDLHLKDISRQAVWTLSSVRKGGFGIHELLDDCPDKMWQSDGILPHTVTIEFQKKTDVCFLFLYLDFPKDETYTPRRLSIHTGSSVLFLNREEERHLNQPSGWVFFDLRVRDPHVGGLRPSRVFFIQLRVLGNHHNGRDSHIRQMRVIGPMQPRCKTQNLNTAELEINERRDINIHNHQGLYKDYPIR